MTKAELVSSIARKTSVEKPQIEAIIESLFENIKASITQEKTIYLRGFGSFHPKKRPERIARNIKKNTSFLLPAHNYPVFKPSKLFVEKLKETPIPKR